MFQLTGVPLNPDRQDVALSPTRGHAPAYNEGTLVALLRNYAAHRPTHAIFHVRTGETATEVLTYQTLDLRARAVAAQLQQAGAQGERVLLLYPFGADFLTAFLGCLYAGAIAVPLYPPRQNRLDERLLAVAADAQAAFTLTTEKIRLSLDTRYTPTAAMPAMQWLASPHFADMEWGHVQALATPWQPLAPEPDTLAFLQYTSGSTGLPKGVMISHGNLLHNARLIQAAFGATAASRGVMWVPFYHDMGLIGGIIEPICVGIETHLMSPVDFLQRPLRWLETISKTRATISGGPNFAYELCVSKITEEQCADLDLSSWTVAFSGAEPVRAATLQRFAQKFARYGFRPEAFTPCFGMAESTLLASSTPHHRAPTVTAVDGAALSEDRAVPTTDATAPSTRMLVSSGHAWLDHTFCVVHPETHTRLGDGEIGEIWIRGPSVAQGYWHRTAATAATFHAQLADGDEGSYLRSGDLGFLQEGELFITGRLKDLIIIRGKNYYPQDIEQSVERAHPALRQGCGAAFAIDHAAAERLVVVQEIERTHLKKLPVTEVITAIRLAVAQAHQLQPHIIVLLRPGRIAKTTSGKIQRHAVKAAYLDGSLQYECRWSDDLSGGGVADNVAAPSIPSDATVTAWLVAQLAHRLQVDQEAIDLHQPFAELGLDSLAAVELIEQLRLWLLRNGRPAELNPTMLWDFPTIATLAAHLASVRPVAAQPPTEPAPTDPLLAELQRLEQLLASQA